MNSPISISIPLIVLSLFLIASPVFSQISVSTIKAEELVEYDQQPEKVKRLIDLSLELTRKKLAYMYGSASPKQGGMDCSGTIYYLLKSMGQEEVPRMAYTIYLWAQKHESLTKLSKVYSPDHASLAPLKPGDLLFWEGTYAVGNRYPPISHVMIYLGTSKKDGKGVLFGASSGRRYRGKKIHGVSVFDFKVPSSSSKAKLVAFATIPRIREEEAVADKEEPKPKGQPVKNLLKAITKKEK